MDPFLSAVLVWLVIGLVAGWIASLVVGGGGLVRYILSGLIGSVVGGLLVNWFGITIPIDNEWIRQILVASVGAIIVIVVARVIA